MEKTSILKRLGTVESFIESLPKCYLTLSTGKSIMIPFQSMLLGYRALPNFGKMRKCNREGICIFLFLFFFFSSFARDARIPTTSSTFLFQPLQLSAFVFCTASFPRGNGNERRIVVTICQICSALVRIIAIRRIIRRKFRSDRRERGRETTTRSLRYFAAFFRPREFIANEYFLC